MRAALLLVLGLITALQLSGCCVSPTTTDRGNTMPDSGVIEQPDDAGVDAGTPDSGPMEKLPTNGSAIGATRDEAFLFVVARSTGRVGGEVSLERYSVDVAASPPITPAGAIALPGGVQVIVGRDDTTAFVTEVSGTVQKLTNLKAPGMNIGMGQRATAGSEPRGIALTPSGARLYVANWADGTVSVFDTIDMTPRGIVDLNPALAQSGVLGEAAVGLTRPGLAHPWGIAVTDDGDMDDDDETVYVTEYFSQARVAGLPSDDSVFDLGRQGIVYRFRVSDQVVAPIVTIAPRFVSDPNLVDSNNITTACFPNLLTNATIKGNRLYVVGSCASPRGPIGPRLDPSSGLPSNENNIKTLVHSAIYVINTQTNLEEPAAGVLLTREMQRAFDTASVPDDERRRMPLVPSDLAFVPGTNIAYVTAYGADAVFRVEWNDDGSFARVGSTSRRFIDLAGDLPPGASEGLMPYGLFIPPDGRRAWVVNENTRSVTAIDLRTDLVELSANLRNAPATGAEVNINDGRRFFVTGRGRWSMRGQAWSSCESCHPSGLSDGVTWFFPEGPRQTISLEASFVRNTPSEQRLFGWTASSDEVHDFESLVRHVSGGVGAIVHASAAGRAPQISDRISFDGQLPRPQGQQATDTRQDGLNGTTTGMMPGGSVSPRSVLDDWNKISTYIQRIETPRAPSNIVQSDITFGRNIFVAHNCAACHGGPSWTSSRRFYTPGSTINDAVTGALVTTDYVAPSAFPALLNPATDVEGRTAKLRTPIDGADRIDCAVRAVGTFPAVLAAPYDGVAAPGVRVREVRADMATPAEGARGFNPPSLLGLAASAPYYHAGNARTLEEVFLPTFAPHVDTLGPGFPGEGDRATQIAFLVAFLTSIDDRSALAPPTMLNYRPDLCPQTLQ
ncbi:hypothetical protein L6R52_23780 [Myxococcota bacterium]|nr:hypothetical protein [Myxococcota bacterium]